MGKKLQANSKAVEAKEGKERVKSAKAATQASNKEDKDWDDAGEGKKSKAQAKKAGKDEERAEAAARKIEAKKMAEMEDAAMANFGKKQAKPSVPKVTQAQRDQLREEEDKAHLALVEKKKKDAKREADQNDYASTVEVENVNRNDDLIDATGIDAAVSAMAGTCLSPTKEEGNPKTRAKNAFIAYEERMLAELKEEKPGLTKHQYKDIIFKNW
eukprot:CAMPEP_0196582198 /NCGR_PEP_ID=MMETSP1081-20130531/37947_1 /TAXON_ID=36882 /ORGANISM="Pyramimonas amylifera, Strain CCMP720" /LENGTH=213 /DNA_ID=CAMNT_0041902697 /DNA_START=239 /DNA_END=877 /DNA_ORIENTATION=+